MDLRNQEEQISRWLEAESENQEEELSDNSASETEDILETEVHENTSSDSCSLQSSESDSDINVQPSKRQRTQVIDSDDSSSENITVPRPSISNQNTDPRIVQPTSRFVYGKNKHKWSTQPRPATTRTLRRNIVHFIPGPKAEARESVDPINYFLSLLLMKCCNRLLRLLTQRYLWVMIEDILGESSTVEAPLPSTSNARKICYLCPSKARRMTKHRCTRCGKAICGPHNVDMCSHCLD
ncbi:hypothetical protein PYW08_014324 [Mythimna loreyi]|uniref:Uncharacterized protein n=2 Tax=Mythimna loreyi TaxID=667449 RepID=A0ACC2QFD6_9NEOP|nr:hypothetical protein PYW08_013330 [Mythimna loreyi]KAJ8735074.1 hypothetical protein PYW08_014324 [Mythimna loreyi]